MSKALKPKRFKYIVTLSVETEHRVTKRAIKELIEELAEDEIQLWIPYMERLGGGTTRALNVRVRTVDID